MARAASRSRSSSPARSCNISAARPANSIRRTSAGASRSTQWLFWQMANLGPKAGEANHFRSYAPEKLPTPSSASATRCIRLYGVMNTRLADREFLAGTYSIADMACIGWASRAERYGHDLSDFPNVRRWLETLLPRPAVKRGLSVRVEAAFRVDTKTQRCGRFCSTSERAEQADRNTDVPGRGHCSSRGTSRCSFPDRRQFAPPCASCHGRTSAKSGMLNVRADQKGDAAANTASGRSSRPRLCLTARRPILAIAVLDRSWRGRYPSQRPPSRRKRTSPPRKLGGGCRRGGRVAEGGGLLNRYTV